LSKFHGTQYKGASRDLRKLKREEAEARNKEYQERKAKQPEGGETHTA
jgi:hypothetical protein